MKRSIWLISVALTVFLVAFATSSFAQPSSTVYFEQGGSVLNIGSGGTLAVASGGVVTKPLNLRIPLLSGWNAAGGPLLGTAAVATDFGVDINANSAPDLAGTAAQNNTKTNDVFYEVVLPDDYAAGTNVTCYISSGYSATGGTTITATVDLVAGLGTDLGTAGADICATAAQAITTDIAEKAFTITGTTLTPGARLILKITTSVQEAGNTGTAVGHVYGVRLG
jgi:hypothetical protein